MPTRRTLLKITAAATLSALAPPILAAPKRSGTTSHFNPNRSKPMTATLHYQNAELSYQLGGKADAPAIVLLHGGLGSAEDFAPLLPRLQAHFRILAIDTRGHGRSTRGDVPLTYAQTADDARQIIEAVGLRQFHLFGFSDGGVTAYRIAAADARVQSVLTVGAQWHSRDTPREMMASLTVADVRGQMSNRLPPTKNTTPAPIWTRWLPTCAACGRTTRRRDSRMKTPPTSKPPCWRCAAKTISCSPPKP